MLTPYFQGYSDAFDGLYMTFMLNRLTRRFTTSTLWENSPRLVQIWQIPYHLGLNINYSTMQMKAAY